ncbi:hypothetical protein RHS04_06181 [Rhizoctonia solani]|uniref:Uncharacterized protein n=1 Tax=Rhizoctonia solani TaxID=456999 RepID=A0A8H7LG75_9AGAM|nr:hypothetical protein RHS04_06181 [Rhizoctonia solani]KAF8751709.1 hypothetical protein RHS01_08201 [Rhizoctonia solani]
MMEGNGKAYVNRNIFSTHSELSFSSGNKSTSSTKLYRSPAENLSSNGVRDKYDHSPTGRDPIWPRNAQRLMVMSSKHTKKPQGRRRSAQDDILGMMLGAAGLCEAFFAAPRSSRCPHNPANARSDVVNLGYDSGQRCMYAAEELSQTQGYLGSDNIIPQEAKSYA